MAQRMTSPPTKPLAVSPAPMSRALGAAATRPAAVAGRLEAPIARRAAATAAAPTAPRIIRVCTAPLCTDGNGPPLHLVSSA